MKHGGSPFSGSDFGPRGLQSQASVMPSGRAVGHGVRVLAEFPEDEVPALAVLAMKPHQLDAVAPALAPILDARTILISVLAGIELASLRALLSAPATAVRAMPNLPVRLGKGVVLLCAQESDASVRGVVSGLMAALGHAEWLDDEELHGVLARAAWLLEVGEGILVTFDSGILFDFDSSALRPAARTNLQELAASLTDYPNSDLMVIGHTDSRGTDDYNYGLSVRRAEAAAQYLTQQGVSSNRITTIGKGENEPVATNESDYGRQQNRRVEVAIYASEEYRESVASRTN